MFEKVNPQHPDKVADRIAGAVVDLCYRKSEQPKVACEVLIGHGECNVQVETSEQITQTDILAIVSRIAGKNIAVNALIVPQDHHLANNQRAALRCGDNGIFRGEPVMNEQRLLTNIAGDIYKRWPADGKYLVSDALLIFNPARWFRILTICQSNLLQREYADLKQLLKEAEAEHYKNYIKPQGFPNEEFSYDHIINPLGEWTGGPNVDSGATNRKLGSDMGNAVTGGGLNGKDLSKADVTLNILCHLYAQEYQCSTNTICSIGDEMVTVHCDRSHDPQFTMSYSEAVARAKMYIDSLGGFEKFSEWGLIRPE